ncbi:hypothetical protein [Nocardia nova]|uniref:hypothetical protein n=1 Tax=Nocardia nova TaxID=37330 RepID=UPI001892F12E|nr:hypothetical protein [Nocardia nova]MBF6276994.1 hypothetical protein [Nocardia nova]
MAVALITAAALAGCSSDDNTTAHADTGTTPAKAPATAAPIPVAIGQPFLISNSKGHTGMVTVDKIEINPTCTTKFGPVQPPKGTNVALELDVQTNQNPPSTYITNAWFQELTPDGYTKRPPMAEDLCIADREDMGTPYQPNSKYHGWVLVDVSNPASSLLISDIWDGRPTPEVHRIPLS